MSIQGAIARQGQEHCQRRLCLPKQGNIWAQPKRFLSKGDTGMPSHEHITQFSRPCRITWDRHQKASGNIQVYAVHLYVNSVRKDKQPNSAESYVSGSAFSTVLVRTLITQRAASMSEQLRRLSNLQRKSSPSYKEVSKHEGNSLSSAQRV